MRTINAVKLSPKDYQSLLKASKMLKSEFPVSNVILFGSKARGTGTADSDIDLLVLTNTPATHKLRGSISEGIAVINLENDVEISTIVVSESDWQSGLVSHTLIKSEILRDGCLI